MGWRGIVRSMAAASRAAERDARRRQREIQQQRLRYDKLEARAQAELDYQSFLNHVDVLRSVHKEVSDPIDWVQTGNSPAPQPPLNARLNEIESRRRLETYKAGFFDRLFSLEAKVRRKLALKLEDAVRQDDHVYEEALRNWKLAHEEWKRNVEISKGVIDGKASARLSVLKEYDPFSDVAALGSFINFSAEDHRPMHAFLKVHGLAVLPKQKLSLLQSGKLSAKAFSNSEFNELLQDYVCSCVLRVAREMLSLLPDELVLVTAIDSCLDRQSGHTRDQPIVSVAISRKTLDSLNLDQIDASDSMRNFAHNMKFKKTSGFEPISELQAASFELYGVRKGVY